MPDTRQYEESNTTNTGDRLFLTASVIGIAAISLGLGAFVVLAQVPPYQSLKNAWRARTALSKQRTKYSDVERPDFWSPVPARSSRSPEISEDTATSSKQPPPFRSCITKSGGTV